MFQNLPWYSYVLLAVGIVAYLYKYIGKAKEGYDEIDLKKVKFKKDPNSTITTAQQFAFALDAPISEWWGSYINRLEYKKGIRLKNYLKGWGLNTPEGYWGLTEYFMKDGRRWYFDFIYPMMQHQPKESWNDLMQQKFGDNERAFRYLKLLKTGEALATLKQEGIVTFDNEIEVGVAGYDAATLIGHARRAFAGGVISEEEAWKVINFASQLAQDTFSSWEEFGKSFMLGFFLDIRDRKDGYKEEVYHLYKQVLGNQESPWNTITWPKN